MVAIRPAALRNQNPAYTELVAGWIQSVASGDSFPAMPATVDDIRSETLRWYGIGAAPTPWYATAGVQLSLVVLFLLVSLLAVILSLVPGARLRLPGAGILPRLALRLAGAVDLVLLAGLLLTINYLLNADADQAAPILPLSGILPILSVLSLALALCLAFFVFRAWRDSAWSAAVRTLYTVVAAAALGFLPFLAYWNLLGTQL
jgi:hypothetical protein